MQLYFMRHGRTALTGPPDRFCGSSDPALTDEGRDEVRQLAEAMVGWVAPSTIYSSDMTRTQQSAEVISGICRTSVTSVSILREIDFGEWEGLTKDEVRRSDPELYGKWTDNPLVVTPPGGGDPREVGARARQFAEMVHVQEGPILLVGHKTFLRIALCTWLGIGLASYRSKFEILPASLGCVVFSGAQCRLTLLNWRPGVLPMPTEDE